MSRVWLVCLVILTVFNTAGLGLVYWRLNKLSGEFPFALLESSIKAQSDIASKMNSLHNLLGSTLPRNSTAPVLGIADLLPEKTTNDASSSRFVSAVKGLTDPIQVYKEQAEFSTVLGQLVPGYKYTYFTKTDNWYLVGLAQGKSGWVKAENVTEAYE